MRFPHLPDWTIYAAVIGVILIASLNRGERADAPHDFHAEEPTGPPLAVDTEAKRFTPDASAFTLYIVRQRWADAIHRVDISVNDRQVGTVPESFIRARLRPGAHRLVVDWEGRRTELSVQGAAGELRFVELVGTSLAWGSRFEWAAGDAASARTRAAQCRLVADLALT